MPMERTENRNVLLIIIDQLRADCLDLAISGRTVLPNLNTFAGDAARFCRNYSVVNPCGPSRTSMLTSLYAMNHRSVRNGTPLRNGITNLALEARKSGYEPLLFGYSDTTGDPRFFHPNDPDILGYERVMPGFNEIIEMRLCQSLPWQAHLRASGYNLPPYSRFYLPDRSDPGRGPRPDDPAFYRAEDSDTAFLTDACLRELAVRSDNPWFAVLTYIRPHPPLIAPEPYNRMYSGKELPPLARAPSAGDEGALHPFLAADLKRDMINSVVDGYNCGLDNEDPADVDTLRSVYFGLATEVDHHIGRVIDFLHDNGLYDSTLVVVTADHGEMLGDRRQWGKMSFFDAAFHTPLIIRDPCQADGKSVRIDAMTESIDLPPTILDWVGGKTPAAMNGRSLLEFLGGGSPADWRGHSCSELDFGDPVTPTLWQTELGLSLREANLAILREADRTLIHFNGGLPPLLFDTSGERGEMQNLAGDPAWEGELLRLTRKLLDHRMKHADHTLSDMKVTPGGTINFAD